MIDLDRLNTLKKIAIAVLLLLLVTMLDLISGNEISFSIFYLIPIAFITWYHSRNSGLLFSLLSSVAWFISDLTMGSVYSHSLIPYWNALVRLGFFIFITYLLSSIKNEREKEKEIIQFIAHDLRSPLASIITSFNLITEDKDEPLTKNQKEIIDLNNASGIRMMIFINSLLDLGRLEKKKLHVNITKVNLNEIINSAVGQVYFLAKEKNIALNFNNSVDTISADGNLLLRILVNLLSNAIKVSNNNTEVYITTGITKMKV